jgi:hypothetical protein
MKDTGGPAFPTDSARQSSAHTWHYEGMTLRDYFAAKAMQAHITHSGSDDICESGVARWAYAMADAMLAARGTK